MAYPQQTDEKHDARAQGARREGESHYGQGPRANAGSESPLASPAPAREPRHSDGDGDGHHTDEGVVSGHDLAQNDNQHYSNQPNNEKGRVARYDSAGNAPKPQDASPATALAPTQSAGGSHPAPATGTSAQSADQSLLAELSERLTWSDEVDATAITLKVEGGHVTLQGSVGSDWEKRTAEEEVRIIAGVSHVHNELQIR